MPLLTLSPIPDTIRLPASLTAETVPPEEPDDTTIRPDIEWIPSYDTYKARVSRLAQDRSITDARAMSVPEGFPVHVHARRDWTGPELGEKDYVIQLEKEDIRDAERALAHFKALGLGVSPGEVNIDTFPLPILGPKLDQASRELHDGIGFAILRGLDPKKYSNDDNVLLYVGITSHIADTRGCQDYDGRMLVHIKDIRQNVQDYGKRGPFSPYTSRAQPFHTDRCDILSMYAYDVAPQGGESLLASNARIYNEIAATRPDVIHTLAKDDWVFDEFHGGDYHTRPLLHLFGKHGPGFVYSRRPLTGAWFSPHHPSVPSMTEIQAEALDIVHFTAEKHQLSITLQRGDIELINNFALFHARRGFVDGADSARPGGGRRHLMRLWLRSEKYKWEAPPVVVESEGEIYDMETEFRKKEVWDMENSPPLGRGVYRRMKCN